jgi:hypothetical protein
VGPIGQRREEGVFGTDSGKKIVGRGPVPVLGRSAAPQPFNLFLFSFSFLFYFLLVFGLKTFTKPLI